MQNWQFSSRTENYYFPSQLSRSRLFSEHGENENMRGEIHSACWMKKMHIFLLQSKNWSVLDQYFAATEKVIFICLRLEIGPRQINIYLGCGFTLTLQFIFNTSLENLKFINRINGQWSETIELSLLLAILVQVSEQTSILNVSTSTYANSHSI